MMSVPALNGSSYCDNHPDVTFEKLLDYDVLSEIIKPTCLIPSTSTHFCEKVMEFYIKSQDIEDMNTNSDVQVQFRIARLENIREHRDIAPESLNLKINENLLPLCSSDKRKPVDITDLVKHDNNHVMKIYWISKDMEPYVFTLCLVRSITSDELIHRLCSQVRNPDYTKAIIKEKIERDLSCGIEDSMNLSLICPLGKIRMTLPGRSRACTHILCFDAASYIQMNEGRKRWTCPICRQVADYSSLLIDGLFLNIVQKLPAECTEVQFSRDGSWSPVMKKTSTKYKSTTSENEAKNKEERIQFVTLDSDSDNEDFAVPYKKKKV